MQIDMADSPLLNALCALAQGAGDDPWTVAEALPSKSLRYSYPRSHIDKGDRRMGRYLWNAMRFALSVQHYHRSPSRSVCLGLVAEGC
jgi:hypothetical protein